MSKVHLTFTTSMVVLTAMLLLAVLPQNAHGILVTNSSCSDPDYANQLNTVYRRWNLGLVDHFYTNNTNEVGLNYSEEASDWGVIASQQAGTIPLYRYWSDSTTDHFYSTSGTAPSGYTSEGIIGYVFTDNVAGSEPLYRLYRHIDGNPANGDHLYTTSTMERDDASTKFGYANEGIEAYVCPVPAAK